MLFFFESVQNRATFHSITLEGSGGEPVCHVSYTHWPPNYPDVHRVLCRYTYPQYSRGPSNRWCNW